MKSKTSLFLNLMMASLFLLASCSKEKKIGKNLTKDGGKWNIENLFVQQTSTNTADNYTENIANAGSVTFNEGGSGSFVFTVDGIVETNPFTYSHTEDKMTLIINGETRVFDMTWEKDKMTLSITENFTSGTDQITYKETYTLKKS